MHSAGPDHLDVPGGSERPCRVTLLALAEGAAAATITLRNQATGEHIFWTLAFSAAPAPVRRASKGLGAKNCFPRHSEHLSPAI